MYEFSFRSASQHCTNDKMAYPWQNYNNKRNVDKQEVSLLKHVFFPTKSFIPADNFRQQAAHCCRKCVELFVRKVETLRINPLIPKSDQYQISPAASPEILHHTVWRIWLFIAYSDARWLYYQLSLPSVIHFSLQGWENAVFELGSERVGSETLSLPSSKGTFF